VPPAIAYIDVTANAIKLKPNFFIPVR